MNYIQMCTFILPSSHGGINFNVFERLKDYDDIIRGWQAGILEPELVVYETLRCTKYILSYHWPMNEKEIKIT